MENCIIIFDLENIIYSIRNKNEELLNIGKLDRAFSFNAQQISRPATIEIISLIHHLGFVPKSILLVVSNREKQLVTSNPVGVHIIAQETFRFSGAGSQEADLLIKNILEEFLFSLPINTSIILVSGDGSFISTMKKLQNKGHVVRVVSPEWSLNKAYHQELGKDNVISLPIDWLNGVNRAVYKTLPRVE